MKLLTNFPLYNGCLKEYGDMAGVAAECSKLGLDGIEVIWDHLPYTEELPPNDLAVGFHMMFWSSWVDFWKGDVEALLREHGDWGTVQECFHCDSREGIIQQYKVDLQRAIDLDAEYVVFHVSEVKIDECFTYQFDYSDREVIDCASELINEILDGMDAHMAFLVENQWWSGFKFTDPAMTRRLLDGIEYDNKGIMLDVGHLLHTNTTLRTQAQAADYILDRYDAHGDLASFVRGLHLHQSLSGEYVESQGYQVPDDLVGGYWDKFARCYKHVLQIDKHQPWTDPAVADVVSRIGPEWVNNELSAWPREAHSNAIATQLHALSGK